VSYLDRIAASFGKSEPAPAPWQPPAPPKPAPAPQLPAVRRPVFEIDRDLWLTFTRDEVEKQIRLMYEQGLMEWPNNGEPFTIRIAADTLLAGMQQEGVEVTIMGEPWMGSDKDQWSKKEIADAEALATGYYDFHFDPKGDLNYLPVEDIFPLASVSFFVKLKHHRQVALDDTEYMLDSDEEFVRTTMSKTPMELLERWRDGNSFSFSFRDLEEMDALHQDPSFAPLAVFVLCILLHDRRVHKVSIESTVSKLHRYGIGKKRPQSPETVLVLHIPDRVYHGTGEGTHARPRMHFRAAHKRMQPYGPRSNPEYREIMIDAMWINRADVAPEDLGTPIMPRRYKVTR
jgi:hypothetical protein